MFKLLLIAFFVGSVKTDNIYCDPSLCPKGVHHVACGNSGEFNSTCPPDRTLVPLSNANIQVIVQNHNSLRNKIANGEQAGFQPAIRMATMVK